MTCVVRVFIVLALPSSVILHLFHKTAHDNIALCKKLIDTDNSRWRCVAWKGYVVGFGSYSFLEIASLLFEWTSLFFFSPQNIEIEELEGKMETYKNECLSAIMVKQDLEDNIANLDRIVKEKVFTVTFYEWDLNISIVFCCSTAIIFALMFLTSKT